jgi:hypothetical protein
VSVPTERLNRRIQAAIAGIQVVNPVYSQSAASGWRNWLASVSAMLSLTPQRTFAYGGLAAVVAFAAVLGIVKLRSTPTAVAPPPQIAVAPPDVPPASPAPIVKPTENTSNQIREDVLSPRHQSVANSRASKLNRRTPTAAPVADSNSTVANVKLLPGERSYLKTIAALDTTIKSGKKNMRPALQAEYERNLALVDRAIAATRSAAKRNPNDPDAVEFMFSAYQSKVDLLNTIADARVYNQPR